MVVTNKGLSTNRIKKTHDNSTKLLEKFLKLINVSTNEW